MTGNMAIAVLDNVFLSEDIGANFGSTEIRWL
jgi:hypothetical protein